jgi:ABC-type proline/glycine betaine transport system permease subunit
MQHIIDGIIICLLISVTFFRKVTFRFLSLEHNRARHLFCFWAVLFALILFNSLYRDSLISEHLVLFVGGLVVGVPAGLLNDRYISRHVEENILYLNRHGRGVCLSVIVGIIIGIWAVSSDHFSEFLAFSLGLTMVGLLYGVYHIIRLERDHGPIYIRYGKPEQEA